MIFLIHPQHADEWQEADPLVELVASETGEAITKNVGGLVGCKLDKVCQRKLKLVENGSLVVARLSCLGIANEIVGEARGFRIDAHQGVVNEAARTTRIERHRRLTGSEVGILNVGSELGQAGIHLRLCHRIEQCALIGSSPWHPAFEVWIGFDNVALVDVESNLLLHVSNLLDGQVRLAQGNREHATLCDHHVKGIQRSKQSAPKTSVKTDEPFHGARVFGEDFRHAFVSVDVSKRLDAGQWIIGGRLKKRHIARPQVLPRSIECLWERLEVSTQTAHGCHQVVHSTPHVSIKEFLDGANWAKPQNFVGTIRERSANRKHSVQA